MLNIGESSLNASPHPSSYGFVDKDGQWVISPIFDMASGFDGEFATVSFEADKRVNVSFAVSIGRVALLGCVQLIEKDCLPGLSFTETRRNFLKA